jgi:2-hydroxycyclohexanecarboxyl-CoA dehydrogenase
VTDADLLDLSGRVALVTGAGQGVGRAIALRMAQHNAAGVVVNDYFADRAQSVARQVEDAGCRALAIQADVTDFDGVARMFGEAQRTLGPVDILVNNAGNMGPEPLGPRPPFWELPPETWDKWIKVNLYGVMNCVRAALPSMVQRESGSIVTVISDAGRVGEPRLEAYSAAKAGAAGFMRAVAKSVGVHNIRANCVALGATRTPTVPVSADSEAGQRMLRTYILRRFGEPEDAANMVLFLASDAASWITGQTYPVNGGYSFAT